MEPTASFTRFIYCYREKTNLKPVYVGSAWDVEIRDHGHQKTPMIPFDRYMTDHGGRENFIIEIIDQVTAATAVEAFKTTVPLENFWMDELRTWHECGTGGQNFYRGFVNFDSEEQYEAWLAACTSAAHRRSADPQWRKNISAGAQKRAADPEWQKNHGLVLARINADPEVQKKRVAALAKLSEDPRWQRTRLEMVANADWQKNNAAHLESLRADPDVQAKKRATWAAKRPIDLKRIREHLAKVAASSEAQAKKSATWKAKMHGDLGFQKKMAAAGQKRSLNPKWRKTNAAHLAQLNDDPKFREKNARATRIAMCKRWNIGRGRPCTCGHHLNPQAT